MILVVFASEMCDIGSSRWGYVRICVAPIRRFMTLVGSDVYMDEFGIFEMDMCGFSVALKLRCVILAVYDAEMSDFDLFRCGVVRF